MKTFNLKIEFNGDKVVRLTNGNFGECDTTLPKTPKDEMSREDSFLAWPVNPDFTGAWGILSMLKVPVADCVKFEGFQS